MYSLSEGWYLLVNHNNGCYWNIENSDSASLISQWLLESSVVYQYIYRQSSVISPNENIRNDHWIELDTKVQQTFPKGAYWVYIIIYNVSSDSEIDLGTWTEYIDNYRLSGGTRVWKYATEGATWTLNNAKVYANENNYIAFCLHNVKEACDFFTSKVQNTDTELGYNNWDYYELIT